MIQLDQIIHLLSSQKELMSENLDSYLIEKRTELKESIEKGDYETILDYISVKAGTIIQRLFHRKTLPPIWISLTVITLLVLLIDMIVSILLGEFSSSRKELIWVELVVIGLMIGGLAVFDAYLKHVYRTFDEHVIDHIESVADLTNLQDWFGSVAKIKQQLIFGIGYGILIGLPVMIIAGSFAGSFLGVGPLIYFVFMSMLSAIVLWRRFPLP